jgi:glycine/D-amino acid oxidase-like deaminating enzyme
MNNELDVAVVGGGPSGLAAAALLARQGRKVTVFEGSNKLGGQAQSPMLGGLPVNLGPHALYLGGQAAKVLADLGIKWDGHPPPVRGAKAWHGGRLVPLPTTPWALLATPLLDWSERLGLAKVLLPLMRSGQTGARADESLEAWLQKTAPALPVRQLLHSLFRTTTYANAPEQLSAAVACQQLHLGLVKNVVYLPFSSLIEALRTQPGFTVETSRPVRKVSPDGRLVFDDHEVRARTVVVAVPLNTAAKLFEDPRLQAFRSQAVPSRAACLDLVLSALPIPTQKLTLGIDEPIYASVHRETEQGVVLQAARYLAPGEEGRLARPGLEAVLDAFQPGWRSKVIEERFLPELTVNSALPLAANGGKGFGVRLSGRVVAAADWASGGFLTDGGLQAAHEIASIEAASVRLAG